MCNSRLPIDLETQTIRKPMTRRDPGSCSDDKVSKDFEVLWEVKEFIELFTILSVTYRVKMV